MKTYALLYARFSPRPDAEECDSADKQIDRCRKYCDKNGYDYNSYAYKDEDVSGGIFFRDNLGRLLQDMTFWNDKGTVECIMIVDSVNRLARDVLVHLQIKREVEKAGGRIEYADGSPAGGTPEEDLMENILAAFSQYERARIRYNTKRGLRRKRENGQWLGKPPVGYKLDPETKKLVDFREEQKAVIHAKLLRREMNMCTCDITTELQRVFGNFRGKHWSERTVRKILKRQHEWEKNYDSDGGSVLPI